MGGFKLRAAVCCENCGDSNGCNTACDEGFRNSYSNKFGNGIGFGSKVVEVSVWVGEGANRGFVVPGDPGALAFHTGLAPLANVFLYIGPNETNREQLRCCFHVWVQLVGNGVEDCFSHSLREDGPGKSCRSIAPYCLGGTQQRLFLQHEDCRRRCRNSVPIMCWRTSAMKTPT